MKITNWRRKFAASLLACGLLSPAQAVAQLGVNLVVNPGFESVDTSQPSTYYNAPLILNWTPSDQTGHAYSHDYNATGVSGFANGTLATGGLWYFAPGNTGINSIAQSIYQDIAIAGPLPAGASYALSAYFSTYDGQPDRGFVRAEFFAGASSLGTAEVSTPAATSLTDWTQFSASGAVPAGTDRVRVYAWGEAAQGSADGYTDNINFSIVPEPGAMALAGMGLATLGTAVRRRKTS